MTETRENTTWLTRESYDRLKEELDKLRGEGRTEIARQIEEAREEGDLRENGAYQAAKEEQAQQEGRIRQLTQILESAEVGEAAETSGVVAPGMTVTIRFDGEDEITFLLGSREENSSPIDVYSPHSPLGKAINGKKPGESATYQLPNGSSVTVEILDAVPYAG